MHVFLVKIDNKLIKLVLLHFPYLFSFRQTGIPDSQDFI